MKLTYLRFLVDQFVLCRCIYIQVHFSTLTSKLLHKKIAVISQFF